MTKLNMEPEIVAGIILGDGITKLYYSNQQLRAEGIASVLKVAQKNRLSAVEIGKYIINLHEVWAVQDFTVDGKVIVINENNMLPPISKETMQKKDDTGLYLTIRDLIDMMSQSDLNDDQYNLVELLDAGIDETEQRFIDYRFDKECAVNILNTFIDEFELHHLFEKFIDELKQRQQQYGGTIKEIFGDLDRFMKINYER
ncbi:hypothetical protein SAMN05880501_10773 [Ureibacillus xyleni]|uniref:Uncharacterized protein n=1 Tax=Ureibacillus xyleni TaxID=614648 RepID=A0A285SX34_9BACL|nr:hypothetical protein [Ureibacillus xyleni]SOC12912.1 hypothetical protein SAMN05880501_10773 [Ureibacillus xyleni]